MSRARVKLRSVEATVSLNRYVFKGFGGCVVACPLQARVCRISRVLSFMAELASLPVDALRLLDLLSILVLVPAFLQKRVSSYHALLFALISRRKRNTKLKEDMVRFSGPNQVSPWFRLG